MSEKQLSYNRLPSPTWRWLGVNEKKFQLESLSAGVSDIHAQGCVPADDSFFEKVATSAGSDFESCLQNLPSSCFTCPSGQSGSLHLKDTSGGCRHSYLAEAGTESTVIHLLSPGKNELLLSSMRLILREHAHVTYVLLCDGHPDSRMLASLGVLCGRDARVTVIQILVRGGMVSFGGNAALAGEGSRLDCQIGYHAAGSAKLDINWIATHSGKNSRSSISVKGILRDHAEKCFRGTIDFLQGSSGSEGQENEDVLMLSEDVVNQTVPVILCREEDVSGTHGASIGRLSEDVLFYMNTRGYDQESIFNSISQSRMLSFIHQIPDSGIRCHYANLFEKEIIHGM